MEEEYETHKVLLPYAEVVCGRTHESYLEAVFKFYENEENHGRMEIVSLVRKMEGSRSEYDMIYLVEGDGDKRVLDTLLQSIYYNSSRWNLNTPWWD